MVLFIATANTDWQGDVLHPFASKLITLMRDVTVEVNSRSHTNTGLMILANDDKGNPLPVLQKTTSHKITYKVAEIYGDHQIYLKVKYWQTGKTKVVKDNEGNTYMTNLTPLVQEYHYQKD